VLFSADTGYPLREFVVQGCPADLKTGKFVTFGSFSRGESFGLSSRIVSLCLMGMLESQGEGN
jgi:hypothetical protein